MKIHLIMKNTIRPILNIFKSLRGKKKLSTEIQEFFTNKKTGLRQRAYESYEHYLKHQASKLKIKYEGIQSYDIEYSEIVRNRYAEFVPAWAGKSILCLAARLGGEVRAFKSLGALAIGLDIEPGEKNSHVLYGDFHNVQFPENVFDAAFSNALDHVYDLDRFLREVHRVLKPEGIFIVELCLNKPSSYEVIDIVKDKKIIVDKFQNSFSILREFDLDNQTQFVQWAGSGFVLQKRR